MSIVAKDESAQRTLDDAALGEQPDLFPRGLPNPSAPLILVIGAPGIFSQQFKA
jgi:hypothetical protein